mmetsp:Transcript_5175/g.6892  ORF Transcript_5175/g.6892 Transcript_5175/m.6892 type:complete len:161 (-) Transcript_5175:889-1371(-)
MEGDRSGKKMKSRVDYSSFSEDGYTSSDSEDSDHLDEVKVSEELREQLRDLPLREIEKLKKDGYNGVPLHKALGLPGPGSVNIWLAGGSQVASSASSPALEHERRSSRSKTIQERKNKSAPLEVSSKKRVSRFRQVVHVPQARKRDPRFDSLSGNLLCIT